MLTRGNPSASCLDDGIVVSYCLAIKATGAPVKGDQEVRTLQFAVEEL